MRQYIKYMSLAVLLLCGIEDLKAASAIDVEAVNGSVTTSVNNGVCTLTVTPDDGYYITLSDVSAVKYLDASHADIRTRADGPSFSEPLAISGQDPDDLSKSRNYTFSMPDEDYDVKVTANFRERKAISEDWITLRTEEYVYDGTAKEPRVTVRGLTVGKDYEYTYINNVNAGTASVVIKGLSIYGGTVNADYTIAPKAITVTAEDNTKVYGEKDPVFTYKATGLLEGDQVTGLLSRESGEDIGTYPITQGTVTASENYTITFVGALFTITKKNLENISVIVNEAELVFDGKEKQPTVTVFYGEDVMPSSNYKISYSNNINAGVANLNVSAVNEGNYNFSSVSATFTISPAGLTVTAENNTKVYGEDDPLLTYQVTGLVDDEKLTGALSRESGENVGDYPITKGTLAASDNYTISFIGATFTITQKNVENVAVVADDAVLVYDGTAKQPSVTVSIGEDVVPTSDYTIEYSNNINAGTANVSVTAVSSYNYAFTSSTTFTIGRAILAVAAENGTKVYDEEDPELTYQLTGLVEGDNLTGALSREEGENVGEYPITLGTLAASDNYTITFIGATFTITKADAIVKTTPSVKEDQLVYTGGEQKLIKIGTAKGGEMEYNLDGGDYSKDNPTATNAGDYQVGYRVIGDSNHNSIDGGSLTVTIAKAASVIEAVPTAKALLFNGEEQELIEAGKAQYGVMEYSLDDDTYSTDIPTGEAAQTYTVWYRVIGDENHADIAATSLTVRIASLSEPVLTAPTGKSLTYSGVAQELVNAGVAEGGKVLYSLDGTNYNEGIPTGIVPEKYRVWYYVEGDETHENIPPASIDVTIEPATLTIIADDKQIFVDDPLPTLTYSYEGFVNGETPSVVVRPPTIYTKAQDGSKDGFFDIVVEGGAAIYYKIETKNGKLTISPKLTTENGEDVAGHITENEEGEVSAVITELSEEIFIDVEMIPVTEDGRFDMPTTVVGSNGEAYSVSEVASDAFNAMPASVILVLPEGVNTSEPVTNVVNGDGSCQEMNLSEVQSLVLPITVEVETVIYEREVSQNRFTVSLPYPLPIPAGFRAFSLKADQGASALFDEVNNGMLEAFQPYVLVADEPASARALRRDATTPSYTIDLSGSNATIDPTRPEEIIERGGMKMYGCITGLTHAQGVEKQAYILQDDYSWQMTASSASEDADKIYLAPFQAYLCSEDETPVTDIASIFEESEVTGISVINAEKPERTYDGVYDLSGRKVQPRSKGLYIKNGKKVYIK